MQPSKPNDPELNRELLVADLSSRLHDALAENRYLKRVVGRIKRRRGLARQVRTIRRKFHAGRRRLRLRRLLSHPENNEDLLGVTAGQRHFEILVLHTSDHGHLERALSPLLDLGENCRNVRVWISPRVADGSLAWAKAHETEKWEVFGVGSIPQWNDVLETATGSLVVVLSSEVTLSKTGILHLIASLEAPPKSAASTACINNHGTVLIPTLAWNRGRPKLRWSSPPPGFESPVLLGGWAFVVERALSRVEGLSLESGTEALAVAISREIESTGRCIAVSQSSQANVIGERTGLTLGREIVPKSRDRFLSELKSAPSTIPFHLAVCRSIREALPDTHPMSATVVLSFHDQRDADVVLIAQRSDLMALPTKKWLEATRAFFGDVTPNDELIEVADLCDIVISPSDDLRDSWMKALTRHKPKRRWLVIGCDGIEEINDATSWSQWLGTLVP